MGAAPCDAPARPASITVTCSAWIGRSAAAATPTVAATPIAPVATVDSSVGNAPVTPEAPAEAAAAELVAVANSDWGKSGSSC